MNVTLFRNRVFADVIKFRLLISDHPGFRVGPKSSDGRSYKKPKRRRHSGTQKGRPCEDRSRDWNPADTKEGRDQILPMSLQKKNNLANVWISDFWPPDCGKANFCCSKPPRLGGSSSSPRKRTH